MSSQRLWSISSASLRRQRLFEAHSTITCSVVSASASGPSSGHTRWTHSSAQATGQQLTTDTPLESPQRGTDAAHHSSKGQRTRGNRVREVRNDGNGEAAQKDRLRTRPRRNNPEKDLWMPAYRQAKEDKAAFREAMALFEKMTFEEKKTHICEKLGKIARENAYEDHPSLQEQWGSLCVQASNTKDMTSCLVVLGLWSEASKMCKALAPPSSMESSAMNSAFFDLEYPEVPFYAFMNQEETGYVCGKASLRKLQRRLLVKLAQLTNLDSVLQSQEKINGFEETQSLMQGLVEPLEEWQEEKAATGDQESTEVKVIHGQLALIDAMLAIAGVIPSPQYKVDSILILQAIKAILDTFQLCDRPSDSIPVFGKQVRLRLEAVLRYYVQHVPHELLATEFKNSFFYFAVQDRLAKYFEANEHQTANQKVKEEVMAAFEEMVRPIPWHHQTRYHKFKDHQRLEAE
jgi:hypothetical protein